MIYDFNEFMIAQVTKWVYTVSTEQYEILLGMIALFSVDKLPIFSVEKKKMPQYQGMKILKYSIYGTTCEQRYARYV